MTALADLDDVRDLWRPVEAHEQKRVSALLIAASGMVHRAVAVPADGDLRETARLVVVDMVAEAMVPNELRGKRQYSTSVGGMAVSMTLLNPAATLTLTEQMLEMMGVSATAPRWHFSDEKEQPWH